MDWSHAEETRRRRFHLKESTVDYGKKRVDHLEHHGFTALVLDLQIANLFLVLWLIRNLSMMVFDL